MRLMMMRRMLMKREGTKRRPLSGNEPLRRRDLQRHESRTLRFECARLAAGPEKTDSGAASFAGG